MQSSMLQYCDGDFDVKAVHIFGRNAGSALGVVEANLPLLKHGVAASGAAGGHIALLSRYNTLVGGSCWSLSPHRRGLAGPLASATPTWITCYDSGHSSTPHRRALCDREHDACLATVSTAEAASRSSSEK